MELYLFVLREGKNIFLARQFSARPRLLARRGHGFHTRPSNSGFDQTFMPCSGYISFAAEQRVGYQISWVDLQREVNLSVKSVGLPIARGKLVFEFNFHKEGVNLPCCLYKRNKY